MKSVIFLFSMLSAFSALASAEGEARFEAALQSAYAQAVGKDPKVTKPEDRLEAAQKFFWMSKARTMCEFSTESTGDCLSALSYEDHFDSKKFCVAAPKNMKNRCQREGNLITKTLDAYDHDAEATNGRAADLNALAKKIVERAQKERTTVTPNGAPIPGAR